MPWHTIGEIAIWFVAAALIVLAGTFVVGAIRVLVEGSAGFAQKGRGPGIRAGRLLGYQESVDNGQVVGVHSSPKLEERIGYYRRLGKELGPPVDFDSEHQE